MDEYHGNKEYINMKISIYKQSYFLKIPKVIPLQHEQVANAN